MDLSNFCPTANIKQYKVCPALNFVYGCLEGLDIKFYGGRATNGNNESACIAIYHTGGTKGVSASMCSFEYAM